MGALVAYFAFPVEWNASALDLAAGLALSLAGVVLLGTMMALDLRQVRAGAAGRTSRVLVTMLIGLVMAFSLLFYVTELLAPDQFSGMGTKTDALYFTLSTMATVGYGDVHAQGQFARASVCGLILFNIVVVASLVRVHTQRASGDGP